MIWGLPSGSFSTVLGLWACLQDSSLACYKALQACLRHLVLDILGPRGTKPPDREKTKDGKTGPARRYVIMTGSPIYAFPMCMYILVSIHV